ncbi:MAG: hypothetical protein QF926_04220 [Alphaproteobacteria bacterium]|jgi:hypothetical protein|nr:hypothetical protein [Alphaproteobacteria bacterium]|tara:strand:- start:1006 stop:1266 length:261 start_codon:yes stop_codon:yes gene_type:complete
MTERKYWLDHPRNVKTVLRVLYTVCAVLIALDLFYHKHAILAFEGWFGFYGIYGFVACVLLVLLAKGMRRILSRPENYYGEQPDDR